MSESDLQVTILGQKNNLPPVFDKARVRRAFDDLHKVRTQSRDAGLEAKLAFLTGNAAARATLSAILGNSAHLTRVCLKDPEFVYHVLTEDPADLLGAVLDDTRRACAAAETTEAVMKALRVCKQRASLIVAVCDIAGLWDLDRVTTALTELADVSLTSALRFLLCKAADERKINLADRSEPERRCGIVFIAMGKYGAHELNYSSDIDFTAFYDRTKVPVAPDGDARDFSVRLTKDIVKLMQERTGDGYVFRTDLRLRPDAGSTAIAVSMEAAEQYYESMGQNWERAAMIKARAAVGDIEAGRRLLNDLKPFVWRKYLDYAAIEDIQSIKRQIHAERGHDRIAVAGHNIKLGAGGIREIEFFAQTQQLILGGRNEALRLARTCDALDALAEQQMISDIAAEDLKSAYRFLRKVEHRLQMLEDAQTHTLPEGRDDLTNVANFTGFRSRAEFEQEILGAMQRVHRHYAALFEQEAPLGAAAGRLVFTGVDNDPETLDTLRKMGFERADFVSDTIRGWHFGRVRAMRSARARELLTKLVPKILETISGTNEPDVTFVRFAEFLERLPAGVQLFSLFYSHPELLDLIADILGIAPRLGPYLAKNAGIFDAMLLDQDFSTSLPSRAQLVDELSPLLDGAGVYEQKLDVARRFGKDEQFRIGLQLLNGTLSAKEAARAYSTLAGVMISAMAPVALQGLRARHGDIAGAEVAVLGMGKLGSEEMTASSDLDLIVIYDFGEEEVQSDGEQPLAGTRFFTQFSQRLIAALSAQTAEGAIYEVDMQLRPSGKAGPVATHFRSFERYYFESAWTWEHMALTRARVVWGTPVLSEKIERVIEDMLCIPRDRNKLTADVLEMRDRLVKEKGTTDMWQLKHVRGGLVDLEFIAQYLQLVHAPLMPEILHRHTLTALSNIAEAGLLKPHQAKRLQAAGRMLQDLSQYLKLCIEGAFDEASASAALKRLLASRFKVREFDRLSHRLKKAERAVFDSFRTIIG